MSNDKKLYLSQKNYYEKNKEKIQAKARAKWALEHPKKIKQTEEEKKARHKKYYEANKEKAALYYKANKERLNALAREKYREKHGFQVIRNQFGIDTSTKEGKAAYYKAYRKKYYVPSPRKNLFGIKLISKENRIAYSKAYRAKYRDPLKEAERIKDWRLGRGRETYLKNKKNWIKNNPEAAKEMQRRAYTRNIFKGLNAPKELVEAKHLQLMIERVSKNEKRI
jgi:hypothetical protein